MLNLDALVRTSVVLKASLSLMLLICLAACASAPSKKISSESETTYVGERNASGQPHGRGVETWDAGEGIATLKRTFSKIAPG